MDGVEGWGDLSERDSDGQGLGPGCQQELEATQPGSIAREEVSWWPWPPWAEESGKRPLHPPEAAEEARDSSRESEGERGPLSGGHPWACCSYGRCGPVIRARQAQCPLGGASVGRHQGEGSWPTYCWGAPPEETCSYLGEL